MELARDSFASWELENEIVDAYHLYDFDGTKEEVWEE